MRDGNYQTEMNVDIRVIEIVATVETNVPCNLVHAKERKD